MNQSLWQTPPAPTILPRYEADGQFDVVVIGGGITGLSAAFFLHQAGQSVCLLERDRLGDGDTGHTTAHLTAVTDLRLAKLVENVWSRCGQAGLAGWHDGDRRDRVDRHRAGHQLRVFSGYPDFCMPRCSIMMTRPNRSRPKPGWPPSWESRPNSSNEVPFVGKPGIRYPDQAKFDPLAYLAGLADRLTREGCAIHEQ